MSTTTRTQISFCRDCAVEIEHGRLLCDPCHSNALEHASAEIQAKHPEILTPEEVAPDIQGWSWTLLILAGTVSVIAHGITSSMPTEDGAAVCQAVAGITQLIAYAALGVLVIRWGILAAKD